MAIIIASNQYAVVVHSNDSVLILQIEYRNPFASFEVVRTKMLVATVKHYGSFLSQVLGQVVIPLEKLVNDGTEFTQTYPLQAPVFNQ